MFENFQAQLGKLMGGKKGDEDPQATITADQLKVVLKSIEGKYNNLKNENKLYKAKIDEQKSAIAELEKTVAEVRTGGAGAGDSALLTQLEGDLEAARQAIAEHQDAHEQLRAEKLQLASKLSVQEALVSSLRQELAELRENQASGPTQEEFDRLRADLDKAKAESKQLQSRLSDAAERLVDAEDAAQDIKELKDKLDAAKNELRTLKSEAKGLQEERDELRDKVDPLEGEMAAMQKRMRVLQAERDDLATDKEALEGAVEAMKAQSTRFDEATAQLNQDKDELRHQVTRQQAELARLEQQIAEGGPQAEVMAELEDRYMDAKAKLEAAVAENQALAGRLQAMIDEPAMSARERTELEFQIKRLSDELREAMMQISSLREAKVKAHLDLEEAASELVELRRQLDDMRRDRNFYRDRWEEARGEEDGRDLRGQVRDLMSEVSRLRGEESVRRPIAPSSPEPGHLPPPQPGTAPAAGGSLARRRAMLNRLISDKKDEG